MRCKLLTRRHALLCLDGSPHTEFMDAQAFAQLGYLKSQFCGTVYSRIEELPERFDGLLFTCGDMSQLLPLLRDTAPVRVIKELARGYEGSGLRWVHLGQVPVDVHGMGVLFRKFFVEDTSFYASLAGDHALMPLRESNKPSTALRTGAYLTRVTREEASSLCSSPALRFHLLRCSTNFGPGGPSLAFSALDESIIGQLNSTASQYFSSPAELNHVLAQAYHNTQDRKAHKARIPAHADKTEDMPVNAIMAFCTFYSGYQGDSFHADAAPGAVRCAADPFDFRYGSSSVLTTLRFRRKADVHDPAVVSGFDVTLYPNSVFMMSLRTNQLFTHEIVPSVLPVERIPTRLGYVARCSCTEAVSAAGVPYIVGEGGELVPMVPPTAEDRAALRELYRLQNITSEEISYLPMNWSLNEGDYIPPL